MSPYTTSSIKAADDLPADQSVSNDTEPSDIRPNIGEVIPSAASTDELAVRTNLPYYPSDLTEQEFIEYRKQRPEECEKEMINEFQAWDDESRELHTLIDRMIEAGIEWRTELLPWKQESDQWRIRQTKRMEKWHQLDAEESATAKDFHDDPEISPILSEKIESTIEPSSNPSISLANEDGPPTDAAVDVRPATQHEEPQEPVPPNQTITGVEEEPRDDTSADAAIIWEDEIHIDDQANPKRMRTDSRDFCEKDIRDNDDAPPTGLPPEVTVDAAGRGSMRTDSRGFCEKGIRDNDDAPPTGLPPEVTVDAAGRGSDERTSSSRKTIHVQQTDYGRQPHQLRQHYMPTRNKSHRLHNHQY